MNLIRIMPAEGGRRTVLVRASAIPCPVLVR
jgi:hypothetical protein